MKNELSLLNRVGDSMHYSSSLFQDFEKKWRERDGLFASKHFPFAISHSREKHGMFSPSFDVEEKEDNFSLSFDLPGVPKKSINIEFDDGKLTISGERKEVREKKGYSEKTYGNFQRTISFPRDVRGDAITATHENGVLTVVLPKKKASKPKLISIQ